jgi:hypothetical protein
MKEMPMNEEHVSSDLIRTKKSGNRKFEIALLLVLGMLVGFSVKTEASKKITMGSGDYLLSQKDASSYDLNAIQKDLTARGESAGVASPKAAGGSCGQ